MVKSHQIKLYPSKSQECLLVKSCGVARFAYNWALAKWKEDYNNGVKNSAYSLIKHLNSIKRSQFPFMQETSKTCSQYAIHNLYAAFKRMWEDGSGYPKFKKKGVKDSFLAVENKETFKQKDYKIWIPRIGWIKCAENLRFNGNANNVTIKRVANLWFAVVTVDIISNEPTVESENQTRIGVDLGIKSMIVLSNGITFKNPKALSSNLKCLNRMQRRIKKKKKGSNAYKRQQIKVAKKYYKVQCIRKTAIHSATSFIVKNYHQITIEYLDVKHMVLNRNLSKALSDVSFGEIVRQLTYKAKWANRNLVVADKWFPSSKKCSGCGEKKDVLKLSERIYKCGNCGLEIDRDLNAAINLANYSPTLKCKGSKAFGEGSSVAAMRYSPLMKNEINY